MTLPFISKVLDSRHKNSIESWISSRVFTFLEDWLEGGSYNNFKEEYPKRVVTKSSSTCLQSQMLSDFNFLYLNEKKNESMLDYFVFSIISVVFVIHSIVLLINFLCLVAVYLVDCWEVLTTTSKPTIL